MGRRGRSARVPPAAEGRAGGGGAGACSHPTGYCCESRKSSFQRIRRSKERSRPQAGAQAGARVRDFNTRHRATSPFTVPVSQGCLTDTYAGHPPRVRALWGFHVGDMLYSSRPLSCA